MEPPLCSGGTPCDLLRRAQDLEMADRSPVYLGYRAHIAPSARSVSRCRSSDWEPSVFGTRASPACVVNGRLRQEGESRGGAGAYQKGEKTFRPGMKGLGDGNGITPTVFTMFFHKNDYWDSHRRTRNSPPTVPPSFPPRWGTRTGCRFARSERIPHSQADAHERERAVCTDAECHRLAAVET